MSNIYIYHSHELFDCWIVKDWIALLGLGNTLPHQNVAVDKKNVGNWVKSMKRTINTTTLHMKYYRFIAAADVVVVVAVAAAAGVVCVCCCCCSGPPLCWLTDETSPHLLPFFFRAADLARIFRCGRPASRGCWLKPCWLIISDAKLGFNHQEKKHPKENLNNDGQISPNLFHWFRWWLTGLNIINTPIL